MAEKGSEVTASQAWAPCCPVRLCRSGESALVVVFAAEGAAFSSFSLQEYQVMRRLEMLLGSDRPLSCWARDP